MRGAETAAVISHRLQGLLLKEFGQGLIHLLASSGG